MKGICLIVGLFLLSVSAQADLIYPDKIDIDIVGGGSVTTPITIENTGASGTYYISKTVYPDSDGLFVTHPSTVYVPSGSSLTFDFRIDADFYLSPGAYEVTLSFSKESSGDSSTKTRIHTIHVYPPTNQTIVEGTNQPRYSLSIRYYGCGHVEQIPWMESYPNGTEVVLIATPCPNYNFSNYEGYGKDNSIVLVMDSNKTIDVYFTREKGSPEASLPFSPFVVFILGILALLFLLVRKKKKKGE